MTDRCHSVNSIFTGPVFYEQSFNWSCNEQLKIIILDNVSLEVSVILHYQSCLIINFGDFKVTSLYPNTSAGLFNSKVTPHYSPFGELELR